MIVNHGQRMESREQKNILLMKLDQLCHDLIWETANSIQIGI